MLTIYLHNSQQALLTELRKVWPDLCLAPRSAYPGYATYRVPLADGNEGLVQKSWLLEHRVLYMDIEALRERRARAFMRNALLDPHEYHALSFSFARVRSYDPQRHRIRVRSHEHEATLYLSEEWTGRERAPFGTWVAPLWVCRQENNLLAYSMNERGLLSYVVRCFPSEEEMLSWLLESRYLQIYCFSFTPQICGLYCRIHDDGIPDIARVDL